ncbi:MAG: thioesterase [Eubacteriales bacterium]|nr:thioesterase [Eubacteriales bacterium]
MYKMNIQVRYSEVDQHGKVPLHQIVEYFQDSGTFQSIALGLGVKGALEDGRAWYLLAWDIKVQRYPALCEKLTVITEPYKMRGFYGYRRYFIVDENGEQIAEADSNWILMNTKKMIPVKISEELTRIYIPDAPDTTVRVKRKLSSEGEWKDVEQFIVSKIFLDSNRHVNNANYISWAEDTLPEGRCVTGVKVDYRQSAFLHDEIFVSVSEEEPRWRVRYKNQEGTLLALVELDTVAIEKSEEVAEDA